MGNVQAEYSADHVSAAVSNPIYFILIAEYDVLWDSQVTGVGRGSVQLYRLR